MAQKQRRGSGEKPPAKALRSPTRYRSVSLCSQRATTSREFASWEGISQELASYYLREMTKDGYLYVSDVELVNGRPRHLYAAERPALLVDQEFARMGPDQRFGITEATLREFSLHCEAAKEAGALARGGGNHLWCANLKLCVEGWPCLMTALLCVFKRALEIEACSSIRLRHSGTNPLPRTIALAGFESPADLRANETADFFERFFPRSHMALESGLLDARVDSHLTWIPLILDEPGRVELGEELQWLRVCAYEIAQRSANRLRQRAEPPIHTTFAAADFDACLDAAHRDPAATG